MDQLEFSRTDYASMFDFMIVGGLQAVLPYTVEASDLFIKTHMSDTDRTIDSSGPFLALFGQKPEVRYSAESCWCWFSLVVLCFPCRGT